MEESVNMFAFDERKCLFNVVFVEKVSVIDIFEIGFSGFRALPAFQNRESAHSIGNHTRMVLKTSLIRVRYVSVGDILCQYKPNSV
jgi:hypothetical protein